MQTYAVVGDTILLHPTYKSIAKLNPHHKEKVVSGVAFDTLPFNTESVMYLRDCGVDIKGPISHGRYKFNGRFSPFKHQIETADFLSTNGRSFCLNGLGCVDKDTEYLSKDGWVKISDYVSGEVAQYHPDTKEIEFVEPDKFVKLPCENMIHFKTKYGVDQMLSPEHRMLLTNSETKNGTHTLQANAVSEAIGLWTQDHKFPRGSAARMLPPSPSRMGVPIRFDVPDTSGVAYADSELRLAVAVCADGYIPNTNTMFTVVRLKKEHKKRRLRDLLQEAGLEYQEQIPEYVGAEGFSVFKFYFSKGFKVFPSNFFTANKKQLSIIASEALLWDGDNEKRFFSRKKQNADLVQFAMTTTEGSASSTLDERGDYTVIWAKNKEVTSLTGTTTDGRKLANNTPVKSPDGFKYCFSVPSTYLVFRRNGRIFASGNTGKTGSAIWAADYLMQVGAVSRVLVLGPLSCLQSVWGSELFNLAPDKGVAILHGAAKKRRELLEKDAEWNILNHDGIKVMADSLVGKFDLVILDESSAFKNHRSERYKALKKVLNAKGPNGKLPMFWAMTGTPMPQNPTDAWAMCKLINPHFKDPFFMFREMTMDKVSAYKWVSKPDALTHVRQAMQPAIRFRKEDCLDMPPVTFMRRHVDLTKAQKDAEKSMKKDWLVEDEDGVLTTAANAAVRMQKLLQIYQGILIQGEGGTVQDLGATQRVQACMDIIEESDGKVIILAPFRAVVRGLCEKLKDYGAEFVDGSVPEHVRSKIFDGFQNNSTMKVLVAHPKTVSHGLTLTAASTTVWYGPTFSAETYEQANNRMNRPGQIRAMNIVHIESSPLENGIFDAVSGKVMTQDALLEMYSEIMEK